MAICKALEDIPTYPHMEIKRKISPLALPIENIPLLQEVSNFSSCNDTFYLVSHSDG